jgi:hypothetical protein
VLLGVVAGVSSAVGVQSEGDFSTTAARAHGRAEIAAPRGVRRDVRSVAAASPQDGSSLSGGWSTPETIARGGAQDLAVGIDAVGNVVAAWSAGGAAANRRRVYVSIRSVVTGRWSPPRRFGRNSDGDIAVAVSRDGAIALVWGLTGPDATAVYAVTGTTEAGLGNSVLVARAAFLAIPQVGISTDGVARSPGSSLTVSRPGLCKQAPGSGGRRCGSRRSWSRGRLSLR